MIYQKLYLKFERKGLVYGYLLIATYFWKDPEPNKLIQKKEKHWGSVVH